MIFPMQLMTLLKVSPMNISRISCDKLAVCLSSSHDVEGQLCGYAEAVFSWMKNRGLQKRSVCMVWLAPGEETSCHTIKRFRFNLFIE